MTMNRALLVAAIALGLAGSACSSFDAPPQPFILGVEEGVLTDPLAPLQLAFHEPIVANTLQLNLRARVLTVRMSTPSS